MTDVSIPVPNAATAARRATSRRDAPARRRRPTDEDVLEHYLKRLDPEIVASFSPEQREAIKRLIGGRQIARHAVEVRRSIPLPNGRRFYLVFLLGRERRALTRLHDEGLRSGRFNLVFYLALGGLVFAPLLALLIAGLT